MKEMYSYSGSAVVAINSQATITIPISADSNFLIKRIHITATSDSATIQIVDTSDSKNWFSQAVPIRHLAGSFVSQQIPNRLLTPKMLFANTNISIILTDTSGVQNTIAITFEGEKTGLQGISAEKS